MKITKIFNDNLQDYQSDESELENTESGIFINSPDNPHLIHDLSLKEKYKDVNMKGNSWEETASTANMSIASCQNQLVSLSESANEQPLKKPKIQSDDGISHQAASPLCNDLPWTNPNIKQIETYVNMTNPTVKEELMDISSVACNNTNIDINNIPSTHQIISGTVPNNSFSNGSSSILSDNLKANNAHQTEDPTGPDRQSSLLPFPPFASYGDRSSSHMIQTTSSESAPFSMTHTTSSVSSVLAPFPTLTQTISSASASPVSSPFLALKSQGNMKTDSSINMKKETCSPTVSKDTLQNCAAKQLFQESICKFDLDYSPSDKMFLLLVGAELEKMPEPEKLKRKLAIMNILWKPF